MKLSTESKTQHLPIHYQVPLDGNDPFQLQVTNGWTQFISCLPLPALWVTAHIDLAIPPTSPRTLKVLKQVILEKYSPSERSANRSHMTEYLRQQIQLSERVRRINDALQECLSPETRADQYRLELHKILVQLNRKILKYRSTGKTFSFRGSLGLNANRRNLHYHFFLWAPDHLFSHDQQQMDNTARTLETLWLTKVNNIATARYKPIHIEPLYSRGNAIGCSEYMLRDSDFTESYELFDDWSLSHHENNLNNTQVKHETCQNPPEIRISGQERETN
jgi:hypothetical protein